MLTKFKDILTDLFAHSDFGYALVILIFALILLWSALREFLW